MTEPLAPTDGTSPSSSSTSSSPSTIPTTNEAETTISPTSDTRSNTQGTPEPEAAAPHGKAASKSSSRRGHFKSRLGCFSCKRRRVKCNEARPSCAPCTRLGLCCSYPTPVDPASTAVSIRANPSALEMEDLRFYHQFLTKAFPTVPFRGDHVWMECTAMSHEVRHTADDDRCAANLYLVSTPRPCRACPRRITPYATRQHRLHTTGPRPPSHGDSNDERTIWKRAHKRSRHRRIVRISALSHVAGRADA